jgi:hypothetical protein
MSEREPLPPAMGERRAIGGYHPQYRVAAGLIIRALRNGTLEWIRVADPEAGRVDDLQLGAGVLIDAYQVKWSRFPQTFTFNDLIGPSTDRPSLISQLADGWRRLRFAHPACRVIVHLLTDDFASTNDHLPDGAQPHRANHFASFLAEVWEPKSSRSDFDVPVAWQGTWARLAEASGLPPDEFDVFVADCRLDFAYRLPDDQLDAAESADAGQEAAAWKSDLDELQLALFSTVADRRMIVQLSRAELLDQLNWRDRIEFRSRHEFPPTTIPYEEVTGTAKDLLRALASHSGGYLVLLGTPGSGKSTLLTEALRYREERVVRYYAYVPETLEPNSIRGEAVNFLHDTVLALDHLGFRSGDALPRNDLALLGSRFREQLRQLHKNYTETGRKTILIVDGLDHIAREQAPQRSLLRELPLLQQVPVGVYIILGSQTDHLLELPASVRAAIEEPSRRVQMRPLPRASVQSIVGRAGLSPPPDGTQTEVIFALCGGHPLALGYVINQLRNRTGEDVDVVLSDIEPFQDHIDVQYVSHWHQIEGNRELTRLLALLARVRGAIEIRWVETWGNQEPLYELHRRFRHYFRIEGGTRWYFFHNSFRAFLTDRTRQLPGVSSLSGDAGLFAALADYCAQAEPNSPQRWDELYYRAAAGQHHAVLVLADPQEVRSQFYAGRSIESIKADIRRAYPTVRATNDVTLLTRLCLLASEYNHRENNLEQVPLTEMLLALGEVRVALDRLREGQQLRVPPFEALQAVVVLMAEGLIEEAERIFNLAEPLDILASPTPIPSHEHDETVLILGAWIDSAIHFRTLPQVQSALDRVRVDEAMRGFREVTTESLRDQLQFDLCRSLLAAGRWDDAQAVYSRWGADDATGYWFWSQVHVWRAASQLSQSERAQAALEAALSWSETHELDADDLVVLAEAVLRLRGDRSKARDLIAGLTQPPLASLLRTPNDPGFQPFLFRFRLNRLLAALGEERPVRECVPDSLEDRDEGLVMFERQVCIVARLFGRAWGGRTMAGYSFVNESLGVLRLFNQGARHEWNSWYLARAGRSELYRLLIRAAHLYGHDVVEELRRAFQQEWSDSASRMYWPPDVVRDTVVALYEAGLEGSWAHEALATLEPDVFEDDEVQTRVKSAQQHFDACVRTGDLDAARRVYSRLLAASLGVGYKDYQVERLLGWAELANAQDPEHGTDRVEVAASYLPALQGTHVEWDSQKEVIRIASKSSLASGLSLARWMFERGRLRYDMALRTCLSEAVDLDHRVVSLADVVYRHLLLPFDAAPNANLLARLAQSLITAQPTRRKEIVAALEPCVRIHAVPSSRPRLLRGLGTATEVGTQRDTGTIADDEDDDTASSTPLMYEVDGLKVTESEIINRANSVESVRALLKGLKTSFHNWERALKPLASRASESEILQLAELFAEFGPSSIVDSLLATRLVQLRKPREAIELAERAFRQTQPSGWHTYYDGGTRIRALESLALVDRQRAQRLGFDTLIDELASGTADGGRLAVELIRILPLVTETPPAARIWDEITWFLEALFAHVGRLERPNLVSADAAVSSDSTTVSARALCRWVMDYIDHPANALSRSAQRALIELLESRHQIAQEFVREYLSTGPTELGLMTVASAGMSDTAVLAPFGKQLANLTAANHFGVRRLAQRLSALLPAQAGMPTAVRSAERRDLPPAYNLAYPEYRSSRRIVEQPVLSQEFLPPTEEPAELVSPWRGEAKLIAEIARVQPEALYQRTAELMVEPGGADFDSIERTLRRRLDGMELKLGFRRPRAALGRRALGIATTELIDAGRIQEDALETVDIILRAGDPRMLLCRPGVRPVWIEPIRERASNGHYVAGWESSVSIDQSALLLPEAVTDGVVVAEETRLRWLEWDRPEEIRLGAVVGGVPPDSLLNEDSPLLHLCVEWRHELADRYENLSGPAKHIIGVQNGFRFETPGDRWYAFNPSVARALGWMRDPNGLFRWTDSTGRVMVETLLWQDGLYEQQAPKPKVEVGWGWIVKASSAGWLQVCDLFDVRSRCVCVMRKSEKIDIHRATAISAA